MNENKKKANTSNMLINVGLVLMLSVLLTEIITTMDTDDMLKLFFVIGIILLAIGILIMKMKPKQYKKKFKEVFSNKPKSSK